MGGEKRSVVSWVRILKGSEYQTKLWLYSLGDGELWRVLDRKEEHGHLCLLNPVDKRSGLGLGAHKRQGRHLVGGVSSPLGGPGAARVGAWADLLGFPWAIPFRVGSERERGKDVGI